MWLQMFESLLCVLSLIHVVEPGLETSGISLRGHDTQAHTGHARQQQAVSARELSGGEGAIGQFVRFSTDSCGGAQGCLPRLNR